MKKWGGGSRGANHARGRLGQVFFEILAKTIRGKMMKMKQMGRYGALACCMAMLISTVPVRAESVNALKSVPAEAWASLTIRNVGELDNKLMALAQRLNTPVPMSPLEMLKGMLQLTGVNHDAGVAVVMMPMLNPADPNSAFGILVPCSDFAAMTASMAMEEPVGGVSRCMLMGAEESYIAQHENYAILSPSAAGVQAILAAKSNPTSATAWSKHQLGRFAQDDITLHINLKAIVASPMVQGLMPMLAAGGSFNPQDLNDLDSATVAVRVGENSLNVGLYYQVAEGSESANLMNSVKATTKSLLQGLPGGDYMFAGGLHGSKEVFAKYGEVYGGVLGNPMVAMNIGADPAQMQEVGTLVSALVANIRDVSFSANALPEGADGVMGMTKVVTFDGDAKGNCAKMGDIFTKLLGGMFTSAEAQEAVKNIKFKSGAETIGDVSVDQLAVALDQMEGVSEKDYNQMKKIFGAEGLLIRMAAIDDTRVAVTFGGGKAMMESLAARIKEGGAPLGADDGIKKVGGMLPKSKTLEAYFSIDNTMKFAAAAANAVNEMPPPPFPKVEVPVGVVGAPVGGVGFQLDVAVPMEMVVAVKDFAMSMQGGGPPPGGPATTPDAPESGDADADDGGKEADTVGEG